MSGSEIIQMETKKRIAIENEDFDSAKILKHEIDRLKNFSMNLNTARPALTPLVNNRSIN